jgi:replicative DNA helicase
MILAARPAMGKTAFVLNLARNVANHGGVGIFSLEMSKGQLATRMLCCEARVDAGKVRTGMLSRTEDWPALTEAAETLYRLPIYIDDTPGVSITQVRSKARRLKAQDPSFTLLVVDYIGLMGGDDKVSREQQVSASSRGLKALAKELSITVIALSQLNRGVESRNPKIPQLSDLRESGAIEQDADVILFIYRDEYYNKESPRIGEADIIIAKQRNGPTGDVALAFHGRWTRFDNLDKRSDGYAN